MGVILMELKLPQLPEINEKKTIENVRKYFEKEYPGYVDRSSLSSTLIKSPSFDPAGVSSAGSRNSQDDKVNSYLYANEIVAATVQCVREIQEPYKIILNVVYIRNESNKMAQQAIGYQSSRYSDLKNTAFLKFAAKFQRFHDLNIYNSQKSDTYRTLIG